MKRIIQSLVLIAMTFSLIPVYADETENTDSGIQAQSVIETEEPVYEETEMIVDDQEPSQEPVSTPETPAESVNDGTEAVLPDLSSEEILERAGDPERAELYSGIQAYINDEIEKDPHFTMILTGSGTVEITDPDGIVTEYRWDSSKIQNGENAGSKNEGRYFYSIYGEAGSVFHIKAIADEEENIDLFRASDLTRPDEGVSVDVIEEKDVEQGSENEYSELEYDLVISENVYSELAISFSEIYTQQTSPADLEEEKGIVESIIDTVLNPTEANAAGNTVSIIGWCSPNAGGTSAVYADRFDITSSTDSTFQTYLNAYIAAYGDYPVANCQNHGDYPPVNGSYSFTYTATLLADGSIQIDFSLNTRVLASSVYGNLPYFSSHPYIQAAAGRFIIPPQNRTVTVTLEKKSANEVITSVNNYFRLGGAEYTIYSDAACTNQLGSMVTDDFGQAVARMEISTAINTVYIRETVAPQGFELDTTVHSASISSSGTASVTSIETPQKFAVEVLKTDELNNPQAGAELEIYTAAGVLVDSWVSTTEPHKVNLDVGEYILKEKSAPAGYYIAEPVEFTVTPGTDVISVSMKDTPIRYAVDKIDTATGQPLAGVTLELRTIYGDVLHSWVTDGSSYELPRELLKQGETYRIRETATVPGHYLLDKEVEFTVGSETDEVIHIEIDNPSISYGVIKRDAITGKSVSGVTLQLRKKDGTVLDSWVTDGTMHVFDPAILTAGETYYVHETSSAAGYYLNSQDVKFTIPSSVVSATTVEVVMENYPVRYSVEKIDAESGNRISGAVLGLYDSSDNEIERWRTDENSSHSIEAKLEAGQSYYVKEIDTIDGYYLNDGKVDFTVASTSGSSKEKGVITLTVENEPINYYVIKRDSETKQAIAGVQMQIKDASGTVVHSFVTSNLTVSGYHIPSQYLKAGETYTVHEADAVNGYYYANDVSFTVPKTLSEAKQSNTVFTIIVYDAPIKYEFVKKDLSTGYQMSGVQLGIREVGEDGNEGEIFASWETDGKPHQIESSLLSAGKTYELVEIASVKGYYTAAPVRFTVEKNKTDTATETITMNNTPIEWRISKVDQNGDVLTTVNGDSFVLEVYDANGTQDITADDVMVTSLSTDSESYITAGYFRLGAELEGGKTYRIHEAKAANGYAVGTDQYVTIGSKPENNGVISTAFVNEEMIIRLVKVDEKGNLLRTYLDGSNSVGFQLGIFNEVGEQICTLDTSSKEYENGYFDIAQYLYYGETYTIRELNYPNGYYRANDYSFTLDEATVSAGPIEIRMVDPTIYVKFRKTDVNGNVLTALETSSGTRTGFKFTVYNTNGTDDTSDDVAVCTINTADAENGDVSIGMYLQENTTYRIHETSAPQGYLLAEDMFITTPVYYQG